MEPRAHHVLIGLFTVLTVGAALLFALWLNKAGADRAFTDYEVIFNEAVTGLSQGSAVQYSGIKVGDVISLGLDPNDPRTVRARIRIVGHTPIKKDTRARLAITGVTGLAVIQLHGGSPESPPLEGKDGQPGIIIADRSPLSRLMANGEAWWSTSPACSIAPTACCHARTPSACRARWKIWNRPLPASPSNVMSWAKPYVRPVPPPARRPN